MVRHHRFGRRRDNHSHVRSAANRTPQKREPALFRPQRSRRRADRLFAFLQLQFLRFRRRSFMGPDKPLRHREVFS